MAVARGYIKLCEAAPVDGGDAQFAFSCGTDHHGLVGSLLYRAQNVRAVMQEEEMSASRGVLAAPSQQK